MDLNRKIELFAAKLRFQTPEQAYVQAQEAEKSLALESDWVASTFLSQLLLVSRSPFPVLDRERARALLADAGSPVSIEDLEGRFWVRFVLGRLEVPRAIAHALHRENEVRLAEPERTALKLLYDARRDKMATRVLSVNAVRELRDKHAQAHPRTPSLEDLIAADVVSSVEADENADYALGAGKWSDENPWQTLSDRVAALCWDELISRSPDEPDAARFDAWLELTATLASLSGAPAHMKPDTRERFLDAALKKILDEPDLLGSEREIDRIRFETDLRLDVPLLATPVLREDHSPLQRHRWWDQFDRINLYDHRCRSELDSLIVGIIAHERGMGLYSALRPRTLELLRASGDRPYLAYRVPLSVRLAAPDVIALLVASPDMASLGMELLTQIDLPESVNAVSRDAQTRLAQAEVLRTGLVTEAVEVFVDALSTGVRETGRAGEDGPRALAETLLVLAEDLFKVGQRDGGNSPRRAVMEARLDAAFQAIKHARPPLLMMFAQELNTLWVAYARERVASRPEFELLPLPEMALLVRLMSAIESRQADFGESADDRTAQIGQLAGSVVSLYREELERLTWAQAPTTITHPVSWTNDLPEADLIPWERLLIVLHERARSAELVRPTDFEGMFARILAMTAPSEASIPGQVPDEHRRQLMDATIRRIRLHLRLLLRLHERITRQASSIDMDAASLQEIVVLIEDEVGRILTTYAKGDETSKRPPLFEADLEHQIIINGVDSSLLIDTLERVNRFAAARRHPTLSQWLAEDTPAVTIMALEHALPESVKNQAESRLESIDWATYLESNFFITELESIAQSASAAAPTSVARRIVDHLEQVLARHKSGLNWLPALYRMRLLIAYREGDIKQVEETPLPSAASPQETQALASTKSFYVALTRLEKNPRDAYERFDWLLRQEPTMASYAINRFAARLEIAKSISDPGDRKQEFAQALREWRDAEQELPWREEGSADRNTKYNRLVALDGSERDELFDSSWNALDDSLKNDVQFLRVATDNFTRRGLQERVRALLDEARAYRGGIDAPAAQELKALEERLKEGRLVEDASQPVLMPETPEQSVAVLVVASEWSSGHGGLSTFNRELCKAWARARPNHQVYCLVPSATQAEIEDARSARVELVEADQAQGVEGLSLLLLPPPLPGGVSPRIVVGHGAVTGPAAKVQADKHCKGSRRVHFFHVDPEEIEPFKDKGDGQDPARKGEGRARKDTELALSAALAVGVGPRLTRGFANSLHVMGRKVHRFDPGLFETARAQGIPPAIECLLLGRAEDYDLKGIDIAARALANVGVPLSAPPVLMVRGAPTGENMRLRAVLKKSIQASKNPALDIKVREFTSDASRITDDILRSSVVLMPSRAEGFGLAGLEAISSCVPVLISDKSGLAELIREHCPRLAPRHIVGVAGNPKTDILAWSHALAGVLTDRERSFMWARELYDELAKVLSWDDAVSELLNAIESSK